MWRLQIPLAAAAVALAACGSTALALAASAVSTLPPEIQKAYEGIDSQQQQSPSLLKEFKAKKGPPFTIGYASSYAGNSWRAAAMDRLQTVIVPRYKQAGLVKDVVITQSDLKDSVKIQQMRQLVDEAADAIVVFWC